MIIHGFTPNGLLTSTILSILKDNHSSLCDIENYRRIALFNCISKLIKVVICLYEHRLHTSDMQFGFKDNQSTPMCSLVYKEMYAVHHLGNYFDTELKY